MFLTKEQNEHFLWPQHWELQLVMVRFKCGTVSLRIQRIHLKEWPDRKGVWNWCICRRDYVISINIAAFLSRSLLLLPLKLCDRNFVTHRRKKNWFHSLFFPMHHWTERPEERTRMSNAGRSIWLIDRLIAYDFLTIATIFAWCQVQFDRWLRGCIIQEDCRQPNTKPHHFHWFSTNIYEMMMHSTTNLWLIVKFECQFRANVLNSFFMFTSRQFQIVATTVPESISCSLFPMISIRSESIHYVCGFQINGNGTVTIFSRQSFDLWWINLC